MRLLKNVSLATHSTMRLGGTAAYLSTVSSRDELAVALDWADEHKLPVIMVGDGSNIVWRDKGFKGLVIVNQILGFATTKGDDNDVYVNIGAGENWDSVVERCAQKGLTGVEALSLIPGTAGATPVQNIGAYGQEIADTLVSVEVFDRRNKTFVTMTSEECKFGYRTSRFKTKDHGRFFIASLKLQLRRGSLRPPLYGSLQQYVDQHNIHVFTPDIIRDAVIAIRTNRLPDPAKVANNGSFFSNPVIPASQFKILLQQYPDTVYWRLSRGKIKISAAWLVETAGFPKGFEDENTGMATWKHQALVLVNQHAQSTKDLIAFRNHIIKAVKYKFGITLQQEPELLGDS